MQHTIDEQALAGVIMWVPGSLPLLLPILRLIGFGMFMIKAVLSGRGDEILDLAKTNLWR